MLAYACLLVICLGCCYAQTPTPDPMVLFQELIANETVNLFHSMDVDQDGNFSRADLFHFIHFYDYNGDGHVTKQEFMLNWEGGDASLQVIGEGLLLEFDTNKDHIVDSHDLNAYYNKMDTSKNGYVERSEFLAYWNEVMTILYVMQLHIVTGGQIDGQPAPVK